MMRGQADLEAVRKRGKAPEVVFIETDTLPRWRGPETWLQHGAPAQLQASAPNRADLRCVVGLTVCVQGSDEDRVRRMRDACVEAGAARVIASVSAQIGPEWFACVGVSDTAGVLEWRN